MVYRGVSSAISGTVGVAFLYPTEMGKVLSRLESKQDLPLNPNIARDGKYGINLYRANFIPAMRHPRKRFAQCPVQALVLKHDAFVSPEYILTKCQTGLISLSIRKLTAIIGPC